MLLISLPLISAVFWCSFYRTLCNVFGDKTPEFANRIVTLCHACFVAFNGTVQCVKDGWVFYIYDATPTFTQATILVVSLGYFLFDLIWCLYYKTETWLMIAHHVYSVVALTRVFTKENAAANQATCALGLMEVTNPLLQVRWLLRHFGYNTTLAFYVVEWVFVVLFVSMRIALGTTITLQVLAGRADWEFKLLSTVIYIVSWAFVVDMYLFIRKKYCRKGQHAPVSTEATVRHN